MHGGCLFKGNHVCMNVKWLLGGHQVSMHTSITHVALGHCGADSCQWSETHTLFRPIKGVKADSDSISEGSSKVAGQKRCRSKSISGHSCWLVVWKEVVWLSHNRTEILWGNRLPSCLGKAFVPSLKTVPMLLVMRTLHILSLLFSHSSFDVTLLPWLSCNHPLKKTIHTSSNAKNRLKWNE